MADSEPVRKYGIASGALTVIGFFGNFCQTLVKTCFGGGQPSTAIYTGINPGVGANNKGIIIGGVAASPGELEALLREANRSLESRRADEGRSWREGEAPRKASATANKANTADQGVDIAASHAAASKTAATASKTAAAPLGETRPTSKSASV